MVYVTVVHQDTGELVNQLGPFASAMSACAQCGIQVGSALAWQRTPECWEARDAGLIYQVVAEASGTE